MSVYIETVCLMVKIECCLAVIGIYKVEFTKYQHRVSLLLILPNA